MSICQAQESSGACKFSRVATKRVTKSVVTIKIFNLAGHEVATLLDRAELPAGRHQRMWDGRDAQGRDVVSGIYFYQLRARNFSKTMKLMLRR